MDVSNSTVQLNTSDGKMDAYVAQPRLAAAIPAWWLFKRLSASTIT